MRFLSSALLNMVLEEWAALWLALIVANQVSQAIDRARARHCARGLRGELTSPHCPEVKTTR